MLDALENATSILGWLILLVTLPETRNLFVLTAGAMFWRARHRRRSSVNHQASGKLAILVPAYNEEKGIGETIASLQQCRDPANNSTIIVIADNCTDDTAAVASCLGATVIVRNDTLKRGKGYALRYAFDQLSGQGFDTFLVVDADSIASQNLITEAKRAFSLGADAVQVAYFMKNDDNSPQSQVLALSFSSNNFVRPLGRQRWGVSAGIFGNGFGLTKETLRAIPFSAYSIAEDLEYHLKLVEGGVKVRFLPTASVESKPPKQKRALAEQRARWEGGRIRLARQYVPKLLKKVVCGNRRLIEPLLDLLRFPLGLHTLLLGLGWCLAASALRGYFLLAAGIVAFHVAIVTIKNPGEKA